MRISKLTPIGLAVLLPASFFVAQPMFYNTGLAQAVADDEAEEDAKASVAIIVEEESNRASNIERLRVKSAEIRELLEKLNNSENSEDRRLVQRLQEFLILNENLANYASQESAAPLALGYRREAARTSNEAAALRKELEVQADAVRGQRAAAGTIVASQAADARAANVTRRPVTRNRMVAEVIDGKTVMRPITEIVYENAAVYGLTASNESTNDNQAVALARKYRASKDEDEKAALRKELRKLTEETFEQRLDARTKQIEEAQAKLDKIKADLDQRRELSEKIVERRIADLLDDPDPYSWEFESMEPNNRFPAPTLWNQSGFSTPATAPRVFSTSPTPPALPGLAERAGVMNHVWVPSPAAPSSAPTASSVPPSAPSVAPAEPAAPTAPAAPEPASDSRKK